MTLVTLGSKMALYNVLVTADATMSIELVVEAGSVEEAEGKALSRARAETYFPGNPWELDEGNEISPYIADPGYAATLRIEP